MSTPNKIPSPQQPWAQFDDDLTESLVSRVPAEEESAIENALELQMISIRLQKSLINQLKVIADFHKSGYQPLIRDLLNRFAKSEMQVILQELIKQKSELLEKLQGETSEPRMPAVDDFLTRERQRKIA